MNKRILPLTAELLKSRLHYNPDTGIFTRIVLCGGKCAGEIAGTLHWKGYVYIRVGNKKYYAHRLAHLYMTGEIPSQIDHIDGSKHNNRWNNLRAANNTINAQNIRHNRKNALGIIGVCFHKASQSYVAQISITENGRKIKKHIGCFPTPELASAAYLETKRKIHPGCTI